MPSSWSERQLQAILGSAAGHPLVTTHCHVAWEGPRLRVECNLVRHTARQSDQFSVRIRPVPEAHYQSVVIPIAADGRLHLVARYRYPIGRWSIELPRFDFDSSDAGWKNAASADLARATGLQAGSMNLLGLVDIDTSLTSANTVVILAQACKALTRAEMGSDRRPGLQGGASEMTDDGLIAGTIPLAWADLAQQIDQGEITCAITLAAIGLFRVRPR